MTVMIPTIILGLGTVAWPMPDRHRRVPGRYPDIPLAIISGRGLPGKANVADFVLNSEQSSAREANFENCGGNLGRQRRHLRRAAAGAAAPESGRGKPPGAHPRGRKDFVPGNRKPRCGPSVKGPLLLFYLGSLLPPCSIQTMSAIATGVTSNVLLRAADVALKQRRKLVLMVRETPFHLGHLRTMVALTEMGAIIAPPIPGFYNRPQTVLDLVDHGVDRVLDLMGVPDAQVRRWDGPAR